MNTKLESGMLTVYLLYCVRCACPRALLVLLPLMEHSMRKLCLYLNDCPMKRGCKLDKILRPTMDNGKSHHTPHTPHTTHTKLNL